MYIDRVFTKVKAIINTDGRGNFNPTTFDLALHRAIIKIYDNFLYDVNRMVNRENRGLINGGLENIPDRIREKIQHYLTEDSITLTGDYYTLPDDLRYLDTVFFNTDIEIENCKDAREFRTISRCVMTQPTQEYPQMLRTGNVLRVLPDTITTPLTIYYLRNPLMPKWTYQVVGGAELFDPSANDFQDIDMPESEEEDLVNEVALFFGVNLKEPDVVQVMTNTENTETNLENAS